MALADDLKTSLLQAVTEYGQAVTVTDVAEGTYDHTTGGYTGASETDHAGKGVIVAYRDDEIDGTRIHANDRKCIVAASGLEYVPKAGDIITDAAGTDFLIFDAISTFEVNGSNFAYVCPIRIGGGWEEVVASTDALLLESGDYLLLESGDKLLLE